MKKQEKCQKTLTCDTTCKCDARLMAHKVYAIVDDMDIISKLIVCKTESDARLYLEMYCPTFTYKDVTNIPCSPGDKVKPNHVFNRIGDNYEESFPIMTDLAKMDALKKSNELLLKRIERLEKYIETLESK